MEEGFSKELVERQQLRNGPIFGISEEFGEYYPNVRYELYSEKYWATEYPDMMPKIFSILNDIKNNERVTLMIILISTNGLNTLQLLILLEHTLVL